MQGVVVGSWSRLIAPSVSFVPLSARATPRQLTLPSQWLSKLPIPYLRRANQSYTEFELYVRQYIAEKRQLASEPHQSETGPKDLLGAMLHASADLDNEVDGTLDDDKWSEKKKDRFNDDELLASVYLFLLAGHGELSRLAGRPFADPLKLRQKRLQTRSHLSSLSWRCTQRNKKGF